MSKWVRADVAFHGRLKRLTFSSRLLANEDLTSLLQDNRRETDADELEDLLLRLIAKYRPELREPQIVAMQFDFAAAQWEFIVSHNSYPRVPEGVDLERETLIRAFLPPQDHVVPDAVSES